MNRRPATPSSLLASVTIFLLAFSLSASHFPAAHADGSGKDGFTTTLEENRERIKEGGNSGRPGSGRHRGSTRSAPTVRTIWQRPEGGVGYECGKPGAGQWSCTVPKNSCEADYVPPLHGQGEDTLLINQPHQAGTADPNKITQRGTRITLADGTRTEAPWVSFRG